MAKRQRIWASKVGEAILTVLGHRCVFCGARKKLQFDLKNPTADIQNYHHNNMDWSWRMSFYKRQLLNGNLQVLCEKCNARKAAQQELLDL